MTTTRQIDHRIALAISFTAMAALTLMGPARAQSDAAKSTVTAAAATDAVRTGDYVDGEVRKIDKDAKKLTIKHGEIKNLDMPAMTMVFRLDDTAMLDTLKVGDKIRFKAVSDKGAFVIAELIPMK